MYFSPTGTTTSVSYTHLDVYKRQALYARVSSEEQAKRENSIPAQLRALREYCRKNNIEIFKEYKDEGITGQISKRPAFQQMLSAAFSGKINVILVHKFDRFARKVELSRSVKNSLQAAKVNVVSITEPVSYTHLAAEYIGKEMIL